MAILLSQGNEGSYGHDFRDWFSPNNYGLPREDVAVNLNGFPEKRLDAFEMFQSAWFGQGPDNREDFSDHH